MFGLELRDLLKILETGILDKDRCLHLINKLLYFIPMAILEHPILEILSI
jgi:hypothetical protein